MNLLKSPLTTQIIVIPIAMFWMDNHSQYSVAFVCQFKAFEFIGKWECLLLTNTVDITLVLLLEMIIPFQWNFLVSSYLFTWFRRNHVVRIVFYIAFDVCPSVNRCGPSANDVCNLTDTGHYRCYRPGGLIILHEYILTRIVAQLMWHQGKWPIYQSDRPPIWDWTKSFCLMEQPTVIPVGSLRPQNLSGFNYKLFRT